MRQGNKKATVIFYGGFVLLLSAAMYDTNVSLKLDFVARKKGAWPSRPFGD